VHLPHPVLLENSGVDQSNLLPSLSLYQPVLTTKPEFNTFHRTASNCGEDDQRAPFKQLQVAFGLTPTKSPTDRASSFELLMFTSA
jgi:hypothetical protein